METEDNIIEPGTVIDGKYEIGRVIGTGGMGAVYEAVQLELGRKVALKLLHAKYAKSPKIVDRFHQEAKLAGAIDHDNICRVTDHGTDLSGAPYLVMPLLAGRSLADVLTEKKTLSQMRIVDIVCQTLSALEAAHREKIVHRDLKPDNIFVTQVGDREDFVKLLDFGVSKVLEQESVSTLTSTGMVLGTAYYLAPEQARGSKRIDHRVDIFAMGVILYEALTGVRPFEGETYNEVVFKIAGDPVRTPRAINPSISRRVEQIILKAMAVDPNDRFADAAQMGAALEQAMVEGDKKWGEGEDTLADTLADTGSERARQTEPPLLIQPQGHKPSRRKVRAAAALVAVAAVGIGGYVALRSDSNAASQKSADVRSDDEPPRAGASAAVTEDERVENALSIQNETHKTPPPAPPPEDSEKYKEPPAVKEASPLAATGKSPSDSKKKSTTDASSTKGMKHKNQTKPTGENVIKGKYNTTFVFEND